MRPSISLTLEPGLEQGVPWGRDLYTFVTSAAGHMMRTLQKPRKNRPSKRQVNHRRFLHNMIQRKFADIEAANHRLASAVYFKDEDKTVPSSESPRPAAESPSQGGPSQDSEEPRVHTEVEDMSKPRTDVSNDSHQTEVNEKELPDSQQPTSQPNTCEAKRKKKGSGTQKCNEFTSNISPKETDWYQRPELVHRENYDDDDDNPQMSTSHDAEVPQTALQSSGFTQSDQSMDASPPCSPELSPLSLDSCDFSIQMFTDITQPQGSIADIAESPWADIMDLFSVGDKDSGGCLDIGAYFQSICACQGDAGPEVGAEDFTSADSRSDSFTERMCSNPSDTEAPHYETGEYRYDYGYRCHGEQESTVNQAAETQIHHFRLSQGSDFAQSQLPTPIGRHNMSPLQTSQPPKEPSPCMLVSYGNDPHFTPFEGVAQSFCAPLHHPELRPLPTPPHEHDWLFPDILQEGRSADY